ncbi:hypothetical protein [Floccifex sp.]|uniref:hypothetical protein n=1 Tax=Floccifex sp. TaxID=2815810 RepID=UPI002A7654DE|nr:hypothetical protein [Floccifex sp.]MDD7281087.1 N-acetylmuramoyl-L-alanine amidase [Erysipelotrichaceae bacterium]MDY2958359.1 hypothetical protein [Floccifex sp.]
MKKINENKSKRPRTLITIVLVIAIIAVGIFLFLNRVTDVDKIGMTYSEVFDQKVLSQNVTTKFKQTYQLKDYTVYGENMMLYEDMYTNESSDSLLGKNVLLKNIVTNSESIFSFAGGVDSGINLAELDEGVYEIYVYDHYKQKRVYFSDEFESDKFTTMRRNGMVKTITLNTNRDFLDDIGINLEKNYAFLVVIDNTPLSSVYDIVMDPCGNTIDISSNSIDYGYENDSIQEANESYELALLVKEELEKEGLRVLITRQKDEDSSYYGSDSRVGKGYESQAKVFISLGMCADDSIAYPYIVTSPYTNGLLANEIAYYMKGHNVNMMPVSNESRLQEGVCFDTLLEGEQGDSYIEWEAYPQIRESGGKSTFAGRISIAAENKIYRESNGMYGLYFAFANINSQESIDYYYANKGVIASTLANGIMQYYRIQGNEQ